MKNNIKTKCININIYFEDYILCNLNHKKEMLIEEHIFDCPFCQNDLIETAAMIKYIQKNKLLIGNSLKRQIEIEMDNKYSEALNIVINERIFSISILQRKLRLGHRRVMEIINRMENEGIISKPNSLGCRDIITKKYSKNSA